MSSSVRDGPEVMSLCIVNTLSRKDFVERFAAVAEASPWVAAIAESQRPFDSVGAMVSAFSAAVRDAASGDQVQLLNAHPDLAGRAAKAGAMAKASRDEQAGAGLDSLSDAQFLRFHALNTTYRERFGFPFIFAVKGATGEQILAAFEQRIDLTGDEECAAALENVCRIIRFRLEEQIS
jgi:2-oxo-4-hydroxy-4-carboxy-5-ureidoimidazoline decarboxylase